MSGRGEISDLRPRDADNREIFQFRDGRWVDARDPLQDPEDPVYAVNADRIRGVGPGLPFARSMRDAFGAPIGLLLCARGGGGIRTWSREGKLYQTMLDRLRPAMAQGRLIGALVHVGEGDTDSDESAEGWRPRFESLVGGIRQETDCPDLPVVFAQVGSISPERRLRREHGYCGWERLRRVQEGVKLENVTMVSSVDLSLKPDGLHLATAGQLILGRRFAEAMQGLL